MGSDPSEPPDLVICDFNMPEMNGLELVQTVRRAGLKVPFGVISSAATQAVQDELFQVGTDFFLAKPFKPEDLLRILNEKLGLFKSDKGDSPAFGDPFKMMKWMMDGLCDVAQGTFGVRVEAQGELEAYNVNDILCGASISIECAKSVRWMAIFVDEKSARKLARVLLELPDEGRVGKEEIKDALNELINMVMAAVLRNGEAILKKFGQTDLNLSIGLPQFMLGQASVDYLSQAKDVRTQRFVGGELDLKLVFVLLREKVRADG